MPNKRGALIVFEGCNRAGKSKRAKRLTNMLKAQGIRAKYKSFPNRKIVFGKILKRFLKKKIDMPPALFEMLFFVNLWESKKEIKKTLLSGVTLVVDRYAAFAAAYTAVNSGESIDRFQISSIGRIPKPDCVMFLKVSKWQQMLHRDWGNKRFEHDEFQQRVTANFEKLIDDNWFIFDTDQDESKFVQDEILQKAKLVINGIKRRKIERIETDQDELEVQAEILRKMQLVINELKRIKLI